MNNIANQNPFLNMVYGNFNARSKNLCSGYKTTDECKKKLSP